MTVSKSLSCPGQCSCLKNERIYQMQHLKGVLGLRHYCVILKVPWGGFLPMGTGLSVHTDTLVNGDCLRVNLGVCKSQSGARKSGPLQVHPSAWGPESPPLIFLQPLPPLFHKHPLTSSRHHHMQEGGRRGGKRMSLLPPRAPTRASH